jgi:hypothetical protein
MGLERLAQRVEGDEVAAQASHAKVEQDGHSLRLLRQVRADGKVEVGGICTGRSIHSLTLAGMEWSVLALAQRGERESGEAEALGSGILGRNDRQPRLPARDG